MSVKDLDAYKNKAVGEGRTLNEVEMADQKAKFKLEQILNSQTEYIKTPKQPTYNF